MKNKLNRSTVLKTLRMAGALSLLLMLAACSKESSQSEAGKNKPGEKAAVVRVETVKKAPLVLTLALTGSVEAGRIAQLASPAEGPVLGVRVREGDQVKKGQILLALGRTEGATALVSSLKEDLKKEEDNLARTRRLVESGALAGEQLDMAIANTTRMRAQLIKAQETTRDYAVLAPWAGVVSKMRVRDGDFVAPRAPLVEIYDPASLIVRLSIPEQEAAAMTEGMKLAVELDAHPGKRFAASVTRLYPYLDSRTRTRTAEITLADSPRLLPGMFARAYLVRASIADAITVPAHCLAAAPGGGSVAFIMQEGKAVRRKVETGVEVNGRIHVLSGLNAGDKLIVAGHERLKEGAPVRLPESAGSKKPDEGGGNKPTPAAPTKGERR